MGSDRWSRLTALSSVPRRARGVGEATLLPRVRAICMPNHPERTGKEGPDTAGEEVLLKLFVG